MLLTLAAQKSHRKIEVTTVAALATIPLQKSQGFSLRRPQKNRKPLAILGVEATTAVQVAAATRFRSRSDHRTLSY